MTYKVTRLGDKRLLPHGDRVKIETFGGGERRTYIIASSDLEAVRKHMDALGIQENVV